MADSRGYSSRIVRENKQADLDGPGVQLGRLCIAHEISVLRVAKYFGSSRMTIYKWFKGIQMPRKKQAEKIEELIEKIKTSANWE